MTTPNPSIPEFSERHYANPPVVEALCEIFFADSKWDATVPGHFYDRIKQEYPVKKQVAISGIEVQIGPNQAEAKPLPSSERMHFTPEGSNSRIVQLGQDLLVVNQLLPYPHFEEWREVFLAMVNAYREVASPAGIAKMGVRYINKIHLPVSSDSGRVKMQRYFKVYPEVPSELNESHGVFALQLQMIPLCSGHNFTLGQAMIPPEKPNTLCILLDLYDVVPVGNRDVFGEVPILLNQAHANIVHTFENTITEDLRKLFGETYESSPNS